MSAWEPGVGDPEEIEDPNATLADVDVGFTGPDIETDEIAMRQGVYDDLARRAPGWVPHDGNLEVWLTEDYTSIAAEIRSLAANVPEAIFRTYGEEVLGIPARVPTPALGRATFTAVNDRGYTIEPGEQLALHRTGDEIVAFEVVEGAVIEIGETSVEDVEIRALEAGIVGNGLTGVADLAEERAWVESVVVLGHTFGGDDGQDDDTYIATLSQLLRVVALRPVLPADYAIIALSRVVGLGRAIAMDGYEPETDTWGHARMITLVLTDPWGEPVASEISAEVRSMLEALREVNVIIHVIDATYQTVDLTYAVTAFAEQSQQMVQDICDVGLEEYLSPARWRLGTTSPSIAAGEVIPPPQNGVGGPQRKLIRRNELIGLLDRRRGVDWVDDVTIGGGTPDLELSGPTTLPRPGTITGTVVVQ